jgi:glycosyltransferase involved in cell wall biosynthesis
MKIAAVIPAYNSAQFLPECLDSVLSQTYPVAEIIVVDDGSQDSTREVVESYPAPVRYLWRPNGGVSAARNMGIRESTCPWVAILDADDQWEPHKIERQVEAIAVDPLAAFCYTGCVRVYPDGTRVPGLAVPAGKLWPRLRYGNPVNFSSVLMRRDLLLATGGFDEKLKACEDWEFACRMIRAFPIVAVEEPLVVYRVHYDSLSYDLDAMLGAMGPLLEKGPLKNLTGMERWWWRRRCLSAEIYRCALRAREMRLPWKTWALCLRSIATWPFPFFMPYRYKSLLIYTLQPKFPGGRARDA